MLRYFSPHGSDAPLPPAHEAPLARALDAFVLGGFGAPRRVVVARDLAGELHLVDDADVPAALAQEVARHELARARPPRFVDASEVWLLCIDLLEQPADSPGTNDPVHLFGRLSGPWGAAVPSATTTSGELTITRGDLLRAFAEGVAQQFLVEHGAVLHATLPGARAEDIVAGRGVVLAYALLPMDAGGESGGNEASTLQVFDGLVTALHDDLRAHGSKAAFSSRALPVVDRGLVVARLEAEGFTVNGDVAERRTGLLSKETRRVPAEWRQGDIEPVARAALETLAPGFPDARSNALFARSVATAPTFQAAARSPARAASQHTTSAEFARRPPSLAEQPFRHRAPDWMQDFATDTPSSTKTRRTPVSPAKATPPVSAPKGTRDWMKDFE